MIEKVRYKHLQEILENKVDYPTIMTEALGFKNNWLGRKWTFMWKFKQAHYLVKQIESLSPTLVEYDENSKIKRPNSIDSISFRAMMEAQALLGSSTDRNITDLMRELIAITCFEANHHKSILYDSEGGRYSSFKNQIDNSSMIEILGLYNWVSKALDKSSKTWNQRFYDVHVEDRDFEMAGGSSMHSFNIILTLRKICSDFNVTIDEAWHKSYALVQTSSLSDATQNYIQDQMRIIKEAKMRAERKKRKH